MKETIFVNLYGGPGSGKSTTATGIFSKLKQIGVDCEYVPEYAKYLVWRKTFSVMEDQLYIFAKQHHQFFIMNGKVDVVITDSPLLNSLIYCDPSDQYLMDLVTERYRRFKNLDIFLTRKKIYNPNGRYQTEERAKEIDEQTRNMLKANNVDFVEFPGTPETIDEITNKIVLMINK